MAITVIDDSIVKPIGIDEYVDWITRNTDLDDHGSIVESAPKLRALASNQDLLSDFINPLLKGAAVTSLQPENFYTDISFVLGKSTQAKDKSGFIIRANVWLEPTERAGDSAYEKRINSYEETHDHNFDFLTVGYFGPGYRTKIYEYDRAKVKGDLGEHVDIRFLEDTHLPVGKVMFYRGGRDIHTQLPPESLSVSINLLINNHRFQTYSQQYEFDLQKSCISGYAGSFSTMRVLLMEMASSLGDQNTADIIESISKNSPCQRTRDAASIALQKLALSQS